MFKQMFWSPSDSEIDAILDVAIKNFKLDNEVVPLTVQELDDIKSAIDANGFDFAIDDQLDYIENKEFQRLRKNYLNSIEAMNCFIKRQELNLDSEIKLASAITELRQKFNRKPSCIVVNPKLFAKLFEGCKFESGENVENPETEATYNGIKVYVNEDVENFIVCK